jgi:hypothetical protein
VQHGVNADLTAQLAREGAQVHPNSLLMTRVETMLDLFVPADQREVFELEFAKRLEDLLRQSLSQVRVSKLASGVSQAASSLFIPGS